MTAKKFCVKVYGCQMNVYDADRVRTVLSSRGWEEVSEDEADIVMITGCSVRAKAEQKVWSELGLYDVSWQKNQRPLVALTGCIAQRIGEKALNRFPYVRLVAGPRHIGLLPDAIEQIYSHPKSRINLLDTDPREFHSLNFDSDNITIKRENKYKAYITIAHGCDNFCTYCIVPYVRGRFVSRSPEEIFSEAEMLINDGVKEITLLGQNVNSYGKDIGLNFAWLLEKIARLNGIKRVRFVTSLPQDFTEDIINVMANEETVCPSLNLPIQSGSDRILKLMNRKYSYSEYLEKINLTRSKIPGLGLTTDLIVGFPGETEEDFEASMNALREIKFDLVHSAAYSERDGTPAATMEGALPVELRLKRLMMLNELQDKITLELNQELTGKIFEVLVDGSAPKGENLLQGRTPSDKVVIFEGSKKLLGEFVNVEITSAEAWCLHGSVK
ncbi:MAG: tRNA (N6-isopentenyl adenosine(37)-C2)-methylthiotransferase MiaB [Synergistales bacterium]|nr:tRNA (N6-isopentenyl adenosine(37)-C2)-methylthiotransferase MiaB [Synergistales bacterium]MDY6401791.1 tRNA (N6-isopentenyl adenosine(37)-C2)-methylthiotransferase MiaB [Synergistales bacterium]MDY6403805.1 tRNA (N6-isopentenyl adenosine(37)-C2)-methylthiotransferase MiaB [Synergistales bacterium]MDY6410177.1 tRNA (N6-isopentenyl adenosine(37)-C2)-methylthiotransferase MiaB [Synergistales bacterium]MDY6414251.1 tRNA (N6-isopentenyl adenosine(37)-C2)-methylthiotransferase MiaB [Synergistales